MYTVYIDNTLLYTPMMANMNNGYILLEPKVTSEINRGGSFEFKMPITHPKYNSIQKLKPTVRIVQNGIEVWRGRVLSTEVDFYKTKKVFCEGVLSYLVDAVTEPYSYNNITVREFFERMMGIYNSFASDYRSIEIGSVDSFFSEETFKFENEDYSTVFDELTNGLIENFGGYLRPRYEGGKVYLDYTDSTRYLNGQIIQFGKNLLDLDQYVDATEVFTVLTPLGGQNDDGDTITIAPVNEGRKYIESEIGINLFGKIGKVETFDDIMNPSELLRKAQEYLAESVQMAVTIEIEAFDLHLLDIKTDELEVGTQIRIFSLPHEIDNFFECTKTVINLIEPSKNKYTLGSVLTTLTDQSLRNISGSERLMEAIRTANSKSTRALTASNKNTERIDNNVLEIEV